MQIISHRGAAGIALENSLEAIRSARRVGVDAIEIDVRLTADGHFVLSHDTTTKRISPQLFGIHEETLGVLSQVVLHNGESIPTLAQAIEAVGSTPLLIEVKGDGWSKALVKFLKPLDRSNITVIAIDQDELEAFHKSLPDVETFVVQKFHVSELFTTLQTAQYAGFTGIDLNFWLLNPLTYWLARRQKLRIIVYTVNYVWIARFLRRFFPDIGITTNHPDKFKFLSSRSGKKSYARNA